MVDTDIFARWYFVVSIRRDASADAVADLLGASAAALRRCGDVTIHRLAFETVDDVTKHHLHDVLLRRTRATPPALVGPGTRAGLNRRRTLRHAAG